MMMMDENSREYANDIARKTKNSRRREKAKHEKARKGK